LGCCLTAAVPGCSFHHTAHGFVLRSGQWSLERNRESPDPSAKEASDKPEVLPWRSRLKGYRLGARIFHGRESAGEASTPSQSVEELQLPDSVLPLPEPKRPDLVVD
jgi:hypothetical protein